MSRRAPEWSIIRYQVRCSYGCEVTRGGIVRWRRGIATCAKCLERYGVQAPTVEEIRMAAFKDGRLREVSRG